jgi:hypothetical protein
VVEALEGGNQWGECGVCGLSHAASL